MRSHSAHLVGAFEQFNDYVTVACDCHGNILATIV